MRNPLRRELLFLFFIFIFLAVHARPFHFFDVADGLSSSSINSLVQDKEGYIWIATEDGLNCFDGSEFIVYRNIPNDPSSLINNHIMTVYEDSKGRLWIATMAGLCLYDRMTDSFSRFVVPSSVEQDKVSQFYYLTEDHNGFLWACISGNGVVRIDVEQKEFLFFNTMNSGICSNHINVIYEDRFGNIWFGSGQQGLSIYHPANGTFRTFRYHPDNRNGIASNVVSSICEDLDGNVWVGSLTGGISVFSFASQMFCSLPESSRKVSFLRRDSRKNIWIGTMGSGFNVYSTTEKRLQNLKVTSPVGDFSDTKVEYVYEDKQGNIWLCLFQKGLLMIPQEESLFTNYYHNPFSPEGTIADGAVQPILQDSRKYLWIGVDGKGVYKLDEHFRVVRHYGEGDSSGLFNSVALTVFEDKKGYIWIGTFLDGVLRYNPAVDGFDLRLKEQEGGKGLLSSHIKYILEDPDGKIWFATSGGGVNIYDPETGTFEYLLRDDSRPEPGQLIDNYCSMLVRDRNGIYWIGTFRGLCSYDRKNNHFEYYSSQNGRLPNDLITYLKEDSKGYLWVGTKDGLACIDPSRECINTYHIRHGLPNSMINGIEESEDGNLWIVTNYGISMLDNQREKFVNYTTADGLYTNEFTGNAIVRTSEGSFLVGSMKGFTSFDPMKKRVERAELLNLLLTDLYIFNEKVEADPTGKSVLNRAVNYQDKVVFDHSQNSFSVGFTALEFLSPEKVQYEVMMEGFDRQWRNVANRRVTYTNLNPGEYVLHVRAWSNNKEHALVRTLTIQTLPPVWATPAAKIIYAFLVFLIGYLVYRYVNDRMLVKRQEQQMQTKLQFFTDISHEIRTPLTLILSPLSSLIRTTRDSSLLQTYNGMYKNGVRLLQLVNQIMDLRALEFGKKMLCVEEVDITVFVRELKNSFHNLAEEKKLDFHFHADPEVISGYIDKEILAKVLFNLISNAFKYTETGTIEIGLSIESGMTDPKLAIRVSDTGLGIPEEEQKQIFERFYVGNRQTAVHGNSSGIGLHLTRKLVELHHGMISLRSVLGEGSVFTIYLPYLISAYSAREIMKKSSLLPGQESKLYVESGIEKSCPENSTSGHPSATLLLVEDNPDICLLLVNELSPDYQVWVAPEGKEGLLIAMEKKPDLIISDILMPGMNGLDFCRKIRNNESTASIPVILLTARSTVSQQIEGLEHGADAYIVKPFDILYLRATIARLLQSRNQWQDKKMRPDSGLPKAEKPEDKLLKKLNELIEQWMDNPELSVDTLCQELGLSRTHLNRKVKELTGESPASYIRQLRLHRSVLLLKEGNRTVSEIAYLVGFSSPSYFSQAFRDYFGVTPKEYVGIDNG